MRIYVASSWRNDWQPEVVARLIDAGHAVYDFKNPPAKSGFGWEAIDKDWKNWDHRKYIESLFHPLAINGFNSDYAAMRLADACVMVNPCGRSAHLEAGWFIGSGKPCIILGTKVEPELMYKMAHAICPTIDDVVEVLEEIEVEKRERFNDLRNRGNAGRTGTDRPEEISRPFRPCSNENAA